jgi:hypothetical protein
MKINFLKKLLKIPYHLQPFLDFSPDFHFFKIGNKQMKTFKRCYFILKKLFLDKKQLKHTCPLSIFVRKI